MFSTYYIVSYFNILICRNLFHGQFFGRWLGLQQLICRYSSPSGTGQRKIGISRGPQIVGTGTFRILSEIGFCARAAKNAKIFGCRTFLLTRPDLDLFLSLVCRDPGLGCAASSRAAVRFILAFWTIEALLGPNTACPIGEKPSNSFETCNFVAHNRFNSK